jgi:hypothetical protein
LGALQFGQSLFSRAFNTSWNSLVSLSLPGLTQSSEWYAYAAPISALSAVKSMTLTQARAFFAIAGSAVGLGGFATSLAMVSANPAYLSTMMTNYANLFSGVSSGNAGTFVMHVAPFMMDDVPQRVANMPQELRLSTTTAMANGNGALPSNGGLFTYRSVQEVLFGYTMPDPLSAMSGKPYAGSFGPLYTSQANYVNTLTAANMVTPNFVFATGLGNMHSVGTIIEYGSTRVISTRQDLGQTCPAAGMPVSFYSLNFSHFSNGCSEYHRCSLCVIR